MVCLHSKDRGQVSEADRVAAAEFFGKYGFRILRALRQLIRAADLQSHKLRHQFQITTPQLVCLYCLDRSCPMTLSALAKAVSLGASTTTGVVDRLVVKGLVERTRSTVDHRKVELRVTPKGSEIAHMAPSLLQDRLLESLRQLPELELTGIVLALERVVDLLEAHPEVRMSEASDESGTAVPRPSDA